MNQNDEDKTIFFHADNSEMQKQYIYDSCNVEWLLHFNMGKDFMRWARFQNITKANSRRKKFLELIKRIT